VSGRRGQAGQALGVVLVLAAILLAAGLGAFWVGRAHAAKAQAQTAADLSALAAAERLAELLPGVVAAGPAAPASWRARVSAEADAVARANGTRLRSLRPADRAWPPVAVEVTVAAAGPGGSTIPATARAAIAPGAGRLPDTWSAGTGGEYSGPLVHRDGKPTCPAVAAAFDRMDRAARRAGIDLVVTSGFRTDAEQAALFRAHPDPRWVAPPGRSRHRDATELDIAGTPGAWEWLAAHARRFGFVRRYPWEPWHHGYLPGCDGAPRPDARADAPALPAWVPAAYRDDVIRGAARGGVPPILLAALLQAESGWSPTAVSPAGARGIAQFMPATARGMGLVDPFDPRQAIPAAARLLGGHLRAFGSVPLALAAYNAGPGAVRRYRGVPPYAETRAYVARILALAGDPTRGASPAGGPGVVLVRAGALLV
jgi:hypothetical protein